MPTARGPQRKETARSLYLRTFLAVDYAVRVPSGRQPVINQSR